MLTLEMLKPTEEETNSKAVLDLYNELDSYHSISYVCYNIGFLNYEYVMKNFTFDGYLEDYTTRILDIIQREIINGSSYL